MLLVDVSMDAESKLGNHDTLQAVAAADAVEGSDPTSSDPDSSMPFASIPADAASSSADADVETSSTDAKVLDGGESVVDAAVTGSGLRWDTFEDHVRGLVYGQCMGDAVGLATEFRTKAQASAQYASTLGCHNYRHGDRVANSHNSRWPVAAFTDDSDQMLLVLDAVLSSPRPEVGAVFLTKLDSWIREGFPGIKSPMGIGATVYTVISEFRNGETTPAKRVWQLSEGCLAANGAVMRTSIVGVPHYYDTDMTATLATKFAKATHYDPRCVASCVAVSTLVASLLRFAAAGESPSSKHCLEAALGTAREKSLESLTREHHHLVKQHELPVPKPDSKWTVYQQQDAISELIAALDARDITALDLDAENKIGYTYSCLASGVASLMSGKSFVEAICDLAMEAGDADTNCAVAGALLGCALGYNKLMEQVAPFGWEKLDCFKELVQPRLEALLEVLKKRTAGSLAL